MIAFVNRNHLIRVASRSMVRALRFAGVGFWNLGYQLAPTSYEVSPSTPLTFAAVRHR